MFDQPSAPSGGITWADLKGKLLLIDVLAVEHGITTAFGERDAVRANVTVFDAEPETYNDTLIFPKLMQSQLRGKVGTKVLGRLGQGQAKPSQSAPWLLDAATADDVAKAEAWVRKNEPAITEAAAPF